MNSRASMKRIPKDKNRQLQDFLDYSSNLAEAITLFENGQSRAYKTILHCLRVLIADKNGRQQQYLLDRMLSRYQIDTTIHFKGLEGIPSTNPLSNDRDVPVREYLDATQVTLEGRSLSCRLYIWRLSSQESLHADESLDEDLAMGESIIFGGTPINQLQVLAIARNVSDSCIALAEAMRKPLNSEIKTQKNNSRH